MELYLAEMINDITFDESCEFELPQYMTRISYEEVEVNCKNPQDIIIAAGTDPQDKKVTLITALGKIKIFDAEKFYIPTGPAIPIDGGKQVFFQNVMGRWPGQSLGFCVDAKWILEKSTSALTNMILKTND